MLDFEEIREEETACGCAQSNYLLEEYWRKTAFDCELEFEIFDVLGEDKTPFRNIVEKMFLERFWDDLIEYIFQCNNESSEQFIDRTRINDYGDSYE